MPLVGRRVSGVVDAEGVLQPLQHGRGGIAAGDDHVEPAGRVGVFGMLLQERLRRAVAATLFAADPTCLGLALARQSDDIAPGRLARDVSLANPVRSGRKQP